MDFESTVYRIGVEEHPNADRLEMAVVEGYRCVVGKGDFQSGDLAAYIPEDSIVPDDIIKDLGLEGRLSGGAKNRVKAVRLRGELSQGLLYPLTGKRLRENKPWRNWFCALIGWGRREWREGDDVTDVLGLKKYESPIPVHMRGPGWRSGSTVKFDIENIKKWTKIFEPGEQVVVTEKMHGTWCCLGLNVDKGPIVSSKGNSARGISFKIGVDDDEKWANVYINAWKEWGDKVEELSGRFEASVYVLGEVFGKGVQDLQYGEQKPVFAAFDIYVGEPGEGRYLNPDEFSHVVKDVFPTVPVIYQGPFDWHKVPEWTNGKTLWNPEFNSNHIREGCVVRPKKEEICRIGRKILKSVSADYLLRKGGTEFN